MKKLLFLLLIIGVNWFNVLKGQNYELKSPNEKICVMVNVGDAVTYKVTHGETVVIDYSPISMELENGQTLGLMSKVRNVGTKTINETIHADFYKKSEVKNNYNELIIKFKGN